MVSQGLAPWTKDGGWTAIDLRLDGELGAFDAHGALELLVLMVEVVETAVPDADVVHLAGLRGGSAVIALDVPGLAADEVTERVRDVFREPTRMSRELRRSLNTCYRRRSDFGIRSIAFSSESSSLAYDDRVDARIEGSLETPRQWQEVIGELRNLGKTQRGRLTGRLKDDRTGRIVYFDAPPEYDERLRDWLFQRVSFSGLVDATPDGLPIRVSAERLVHAPTVSRLGDFDGSGLDFDPEAASVRLRELRRA